VAQLRVNIVVNQNVVYVEVRGVRTNREVPLLVALQLVGQVVLKLVRLLVNSAQVQVMAAHVHPLVQQTNGANLEHVLIANVRQGGELSVIQQEHAQLVKVSVA
jgi:hypothetical protein